MSVQFLQYVVYSGWGADFACASVWVLEHWIGSRKCYYACRLRLYEKGFPTYSSVLLLCKIKFVMWEKAELVMSSWYFHDLKVQVGTTDDPQKTKSVHNYMVKLHHWNLGQTAPIILPLATWNVGIPITLMGSNCAWDIPRDTPAQHCVSPALWPRSCIILPHPQCL